MAGIKYLHPAKGFALWTPVSVFGATLLTPQRQESMKTENPKSKRFGGGSMLGVCLTAGQREELEKEADLSGLSLSEYTRRKLFGGRPIVASTDMKALAELRQMSGLFKHQCKLLREHGVGGEILAEMNRLLRSMGQLVSKIALGYDSQKDQN